MKGSGGGGQGHGNGDAVSDQAHYVVQGDHLQQRIHEIAPCMGLPDGHDRGGRGGGRGQGRQDDGEIQFQAQHKISHDEHQNGCENGLKNRNNHHFCAAFLQGIKLEELAGAESDEGQGNVGNKIHAGDHALGNQVQAVGTDEDTGHDIGRHVGQPQAFGDAGHGEAANEHQGDGDDDDRYGVRDVECLVKWGQQRTTLPSFDIKIIIWRVPKTRLKKIHVVP